MRSDTQNLAAKFWGIMRARAKRPRHRDPESEPPPGLAEFEQHVMASDAPAGASTRADPRALRYVLRLERDVGGEDGNVTHWLFPEAAP